MIKINSIYFVSGNNMIFFTLILKNQRNFLQYIPKNGIYRKKSLLLKEKEKFIFANHYEISNGLQIQINKQSNIGVAIISENRHLSQPIYE